MIPLNLIVNADDFGINDSVNKAILWAYQQNYINSTSLIPNRDGYDQAVKFFHNYKSIIKNVGVHINLADGTPVTDFKIKSFLKANGEWDINATGKKLQFFNTLSINSFKTEIKAQIEKVLTAKIPITHIDSHLHLHTLPKFINIFLDLAAEYNIKLRLAQTYKEDNLSKFLLRRFLNHKIKAKSLNYSDRFETVDYFLLNYKNLNITEVTEIMIHPDFDQFGKLTDHYNPSDMINWISFLDMLKGGS